MSGLQEKDLKTLLRMVDTTYKRRKTDQQKTDELAAWTKAFQHEDREMVAAAVNKWIDTESTRRHRRISGEKLTF